MSVLHAYELICDHPGCDRRTLTPTLGHAWVQHWITIGDGPTARAYCPHHGPQPTTEPITNRHINDLTGPGITTTHNQERQ